MPDNVTLRLANPLSAAQAAQLQAVEIKDYWVGDEITVRPDYAMSIINAGYAARVDPADHQAVRDTMAGKQPLSAEAATSAAATQTAASAKTTSDGAASSGDTAEKKTEKK